MNQGSELPCGLEAVLEGVEEKSCIHFHQSLHTASEAASASGDEECARTLRNLADAASLYLRTENPNEPFGPLMVIGGRRTAVPEDFDDAALDELEALAPSMPEPDLQARLADLVWVRRRQPGMARIAVAAYLKTALATEDPDMWPPSMEALERAAQVARALGGTSAELAAVQETARDMLARHHGDDPLFLSAKLIELLLEFGGEDPSKMASIAEHAAGVARGRGDWHRAQTYLEVAAECRAKEGSSEEARNQRLAAAETLVALAEESANEGSALGASVHLQRAIEAFRRIPATKQRVEDLHRQLLEYQRESVKEMKVVSVPLETEELTTSSVQQVIGLDWESAFLVLANATRVPEVADVEAAAARNVDDHPLQHLFSHMRLSDQGKVVSRHAGASPSDPEGRAAAVRLAMFQHTTLRHQLTGAAVLDPVRRQVWEQHQPDIDKILLLVNKSSFVPPERRALYARGLLAGFQGDYLLALHLLVPQIEQAIRQVVEANGILVSSLDHHGIQRERDLNYLLYQDSLNGIFTPGVVFDLKALLVDRDGSNFRNLLAHGLLDPGAFNSPLAVYLWWMAVHLLVGFWEDDSQEAPEG